MKLRYLFIFVVVWALVTGFILYSPQAYWFFQGEELWEPKKYAAEYSQNPGYQLLSEEHQALYALMYTAVSDAEKKDSYINVAELDNEETPGVYIPLPNYIPETDIEALMDVKKFFMYDNPQFFYIHPSRLIHYTRSILEKEYIVAFSLPYTFEYEPRLLAQKKLEKAVQSILADCPETEDQFLQEYYLHEKLISSCSYHDEAAEKAEELLPEHLNASSAYGALVEKTAICGGYTKAMALLLRRVGISSLPVFGDQGEHVWNLVNINGNNYHLDATWNDSGDIIRHLYFNMTTQETLQHHTIDTTLWEIPVCHATEENFYTRNKSLITSMNKTAIAQSIAMALEKGETTIELRFTTDCFQECREFLRQVVPLKQAVANCGQQLWDYELLVNKEKNLIFLRKLTS